MSNYILARWRDASTDPPADPKWWGYLRERATGRMYLGQVLPAGSKDGFEWLDITAIPAVPREAVQAAVNEIKRIRTQTVYGYQATGLDIALDELRDHTGVTPTEVQS